MLNSVPAEVLTTSEFIGALLLCEMIIPATFVATAVLIIAPKFLTSVIIGATSMEQLKIDIESVNVNLTEEINKKINDVQIIYPNPCP